MDNTQVLKWNNTKSKSQRHNFMLPSPSLRQLIIGSSNCGKTCLLLKLLWNKSWLDYNSLCIYGNSLHQPEYKLLKEAFLTKAMINQILKISCEIVKGILKNLFVSSQKNRINLRQFLPHMIHQTYYLIQKILILRNYFNYFR